MNKFTTITSLVIYLMFTQVYPVVHVHAHEHHGEVDIQFSVHPPQIVLEDHDHEKDHHRSDSHDHQETHVSSDWDFTIRVHKVVVREIALVYVVTNMGESDLMPVIINPEKYLQKNSLSPELSEVTLRGPPSQA